MRSDPHMGTPIADAPTDGPRLTSVEPFSHGLTGDFMASNQPHTKRDVGGQAEQSKQKGGNPAKNQPGKPSEGGGTKGKNDSGGNK